MNDISFMIGDIYQSIRLMVPAIILVLVILVSNAITGFFVRWIANKEHDKNIKYKLGDIAEHEIAEKENKIIQLKKENKIFRDENTSIYDIINSTLVLNNKISQILTRIHEKK